MPKIPKRFNGDYAAYRAYMKALGAKKHKRHFDNVEAAKKAVERRWKKDVVE